MNLEKNIKILTKEVESLKSNIDLTDDEILKNILKQSLKAKESKLEKLNNQLNDYNKIKDMTPAEVKQAVKDGQLKIDKDTLDKLLKVESHSNFTNYLDSNNIDYLPVEIIDRQKKTAGYMFNIDSTYYLLSYNHLTAVSYNISKDIIGFKLNNGHDLFKSDNCLKCIKVFIKYLCNKYNSDLTDFFKKSKQLDKTFDEYIKADGDTVRYFLMSVKINTKTNKMYLEYNDIKLNDTELTELINNLVY